MKHTGGYWLVYGNRTLRIWSITRIRFGNVYMITVIFILEQGWSPYDDNAVKKSATAKHCISIVAGERKLFRNNIKKEKRMNIIDMYDKTVPMLNIFNIFYLSSDKKLYLQKRLDITIIFFFLQRICT